MLVRKSWASALTFALILGASGTRADDKKDDKNKDQKQNQSQQQPGTAATQLGIQLSPQASKNIQLQAQPGTTWQISPQADSLQLSCAPQGQAQAGQAAGTQAQAQPQAPQPQQQPASNQQAGKAGQPGTAAETTQVSRTEAPSPQGSRGLRDEVIGLKPQVGVLDFRDTATGSRDTRGIAGVGLDINFAAGAPLGLGISTGAFGSHIGATGSNFLGSGSSSGGTGSNLFFVPADLKIGWNPGNFRIGVHGGGNVYKRESSQLVAMGSAGNSLVGSGWTVLPNAGADLEIGLASHAALLLRPDVAFSGGERLYAATVGLSLPIG